MSEHRAELLAAQARLDARLEQLYQDHGRSVELGLDRCRAAALAMGFAFTDQGLSLPGQVVLVGGTNGKGSTAAFLGSIASQAGYRTMVYSSPHLLRFEERLTLNGEPCPADDWITAFDQVEAAAGPLGLALTVFEVITLAAFRMIEAQRPDLAVLEIGLGGRLDVVNLADAQASILTSVDLDHQAFLGKDREAIGREKAHIARPGRPFIVGDPVPPQSVLDHAQAIGADLWRFGTDYNYAGDRQQWNWAGRGSRRNAMAYPGLRGTNQLLNAAAALACLTALSGQIPVSMGAIRQGLALVSLPGRFQVLPGQPAVVLDVAHNPHAAAVLASNCDQMGFYPNTAAVLGLLQDKDAEGVFRALVSRVDAWYLCDLDGPEVGGRARSAQALASILRAVQAQLPDGGRPGMGPASIHCSSSPKEALTEAVAGLAPEDRVLVLGSFHVVSEVWAQAREIGQAPHAPSR